MFRPLAFILALSLINPCTSGAQSDTLNRSGRRILFFYSSSVLYSGTMFTLGSTWYSQYEHSSFHWFNDNKEWLQMDKAGHAFTAWELNAALYEGFMYSGYAKKQSLLYSYIACNVAMGSIEVFDGYSAKWGASYGDLLFNLGGSSLFTAQKLWLEETWAIPKFSFHQTDYAKYHPEALGSFFAENILKDYNGQTYWLAMPLKRIHSSLPEWLCLSVGYGANGMIDGTGEGYWDGFKMTYYRFERYRQCYLSMDINLRGIKTKSTFLRACFNTLNIIRIPFPALEFSRGKLSGHFLYF